MKLVRLALIAALALSPLAACTSLPADAPVTLAKAEFAFETAYNVAGNAYLAAVNSGALTGADKAAAKQALGRAYEAVLAARAAEALGDARTVQEQAATVTDLTQYVLTLARKT